MAMLLNKQIPLKYIFKKVKLELLFIFLISLLVYYITKAFDHLIPEMPLTIPTFLGTAISAILSFKLSQSYDRWWEARKIWGSIVNESRNLVLQLQAFVRKGNQETIEHIALRQIGWCFCLGQSLRGLDAVAGLEKYLDPSEIMALKNHSNKPLAITQLNVNQLAALKDAGQIDITAMYSSTTLSPTSQTRKEWLSG